MRDHGTTACYVFGPQSGSDSRNGCRCVECRAARAKSERARNQRVEPAYVSAAPARDHIEFLSKEGVGLKRIAEVSGVSHGALWKLVYGINAGPNRKARPPSKRIRKETLDRILAITPADGADGSRVPAGPTLERVARLKAAGVPAVRIAERCGQSRALQIGSQYVTRATYRAVKEMCDELEAGTLVTHRVHRFGTAEIAPEGTATPTTPYLDLDLVERLAEILEDRNSQPWRVHAACRNRPPWIFFPARGDRKTLLAAKKVCSACTVRRECLTANLDRRDGIYGGLSEKERRALRQEAA